MSRIRRKKESLQHTPIRNTHIVWVVAGLILSGLILAAGQTSSQVHTAPHTILQLQRSPETCRVIQPEDALFTVQETNKVYKLLETHPAKEISHSLLEKIRSGEICLGRRNKGADDARFQAFDQPNLGASIPFIYLRDRLLVPEMEKYAQLVIYHEVVHYQQWLSGKIDNGSDVSRDEFVKWDAPTQVDHCKKIWYAELEAYQKECEFARAIGTSAEVDVCDDDSIAQTARRIEGSLLAHHGQTMNCSIVWQDLVSGR